MLLSGAMEVDAFLAWQELGRVDLVTADGSIDCSLLDCKPVLESKRIQNEFVK